jgi:hypothetical protein
MFDFQLTPKGDIILVNNETISSFNLSFDISKYKGQRISFSTTIEEKKKPKHQQTISFYFQEQPKRVMADRHLQDNKELMQAARIELKTEKKNTYNYDVGSEFYQDNHTIYKNEESLTTMKTHIEEIMNKYFPGCMVELAFEDHDGFFWCQTLYANIYDKNNKFIDKIEV